MHKPNLRSLKTLQRASEPYTILTVYDKQKFATFAINGCLGLCLSIYIIVLIVRFSKFKLVAKELLVQSLVAVGVCIVGLVLYVVQKPYPEGFEAILISFELLVSVGIVGYAWVIRRRIVRGEVEEMKSPRAKRGKMGEVGLGVVSLP